MKKYLLVILTLVCLVSRYGCQTVQAQTWSVQYDGNGSTGGILPLDPTQYLPGQSAMVLGNPGELGREGHIFSGWNTKTDGSGTHHQPGSVFLMASYSVTFYARWKPLLPIPLRVIYDGNGQTSGIVPVDNGTYEWGRSVTIKGNPGNLAKKSHSIIGWNTRADGLGEVYVQGDVVQLSSSSLTLYAQWVPSFPPGFRVFYDGNGSSDGTVPVDDRFYEQGQRFTVMGNLGNLVKKGYSFAGWNTLADGCGDPLIQGYQGSMGNTFRTLYARWVPLPPPGLRVLYDGNGNSSGIVPVDDRTYEQGQHFTVMGNLGNLAKKGYSFAGWNTLANGGGDPLIQGYMGSVGNISRTLYARWVPLPNTAVSICFDGNGALAGTLPSEPIWIKTGDEFVLPGNHGFLDKVGYEFDGWSMRPDDGGAILIPGSMIIIGTRPVALFARWKPLDPATHRVNYKANINPHASARGKVPEDPKHYALGDTATILGNTGWLANRGYKFIGWNTEPDGSGTNYLPGSTIAIGSRRIVLYAKWMIQPEMVRITEGEFLMGHTVNNDEKSIHPVSISEFYLGKYEITASEYAQVMTGLYTGYKENTLRQPQVNVSWDNAVAFCNKLSEMEGLSPAYTRNGSIMQVDFAKNGYRLPTEAEWEYAAKGGDGSPGSFLYSGSSSLDEVGWYSGNSGGHAHDVGTKAANSLGLYDMSGNAWEWCQDWYGSYGLGLHLDPTGASSGTYRVLRGGGWDGDAGNCRSAFRIYYDPAGRDDGFGFRVLRRP